MPDWDMNGDLTKSGVGFLRDRGTELEAELAAAKVWIGELEDRQDFLLRAAIDATWGEALEDGSVPATKLQDRVIAFVLRHAPPRETMCELIARAERAESALSASIEQGKILRNEVQVLREALSYYACPADCPRALLKDGSCVVAMTGECGEIARAALAQVTGGDVSTTAAPVQSP